MAQRTSATVPMSFEQMAALDRLVAAEPPSYPAASRASVVRALIEEADRKLAKASAKRSEAA